jgi:hypothetical protein
VPDSVESVVYHIVSRTPRTLEDLVEGIVASGKTAMNNVSAKVFRERMAQLASDHPLYVFQSVLTSGGYASASTGAAMPSDTRTSAALLSIASAEGGELKIEPHCPPFTRDMIARMIRFCDSTA